MRNRFAYIASCLLATSAVLSEAGDFKKGYFDATKPGAWSRYELTLSDGSKSEYRYERKPDDGGMAVLEAAVKIVSGAGQGTESVNVYTMPRDFDLARDGMSYARYPAKMVMKFSGMEMPVDETTLAAIRKNGRDFKGAVTFQATEVVSGHSCDRYAYAASIESTPPTKEEGVLWLDPAVPFGVVKQQARVLNADGSLASSFEMLLKDTGVAQAEAPSAAAEAGTVPPARVVASLADAYKAGQVGVDIEVVPGTAGHQLKLVLVSKVESELVVKVPAGAIDLQNGIPVENLQVTFPQAKEVIVAAGERSEAIVVKQRGARGIIDGHCSLSVYEGTPLFSGSITRGSL